MDRRHFYKSGFLGAPGTRVLTADELERLQGELLYMLREVTAAFDRGGLRYTLGGGSVLGALRHRGFIPWDDDIDINMPRADIDRLHERFDELLGDGYVLCSPQRCRKHGMAHIQIKKKGTVYKSFNELNKPDTGLYLDVFPIENTFDSRVLRTIHGVLCLASG